MSSLDFTTAIECAAAGCVEAQQAAKSNLETDEQFFARAAELISVASGHDASEVYAALCRNRGSLRTGSMPFKNVPGLAAAAAEFGAENEAALAVLLKGTIQGRAQAARVIARQADVEAEISIRTQAKTEADALTVGDSIAVQSGTLKLMRVQMRGFCEVLHFDNERGHRICLTRRQVAEKIRVHLRSAAKGCS